MYQCTDEAGRLMCLSLFKVDTWMDWEPVEIYIYILHGRLLLMFLKLIIFFLKMMRF